MGVNKMLRAGIDEENKLLEKSRAAAEKKETLPETEVRGESKGGRPKLEKDQKRQQYTLTLQPSMYQEILAEAAKESMSFAKYVERAVREYIENHN